MSLHSAHESVDECSPAATGQQVPPTRAPRSDLRRQANTPHLERRLDSPQGRRASATARGRCCQASCLSRTTLTLGLERHPRRRPAGAPLTYRGIGASRAAGPSSHRPASHDDHARHKRGGRAPAWQRHLVRVPTRIVAKRGGLSALAGTLADWSAPGVAASRRPTGAALAAEGRNCVGRFPKTTHLA